MFNDKDFTVSSYSDPGGIIKTCVAVACVGSHVAVRNTNDDTKNTIVFTMDEWSAFIKGVKNGEFDFTYMNIS